MAPKLRGSGHSLPFSCYWGRNHEKKIIFSLLAILSLLWFGGAHQVQAAEGAGFTISPALPQNQIDQSTYFNLLVKPGETQRLLIYVKNTTKVLKS